MTSGSLEAYGPIIGIVVRGDLSLARCVDDVRISIVELPVVTPIGSAERCRGFEPRHVVHVDLHRVGLGHGSAGWAMAAERQRKRRRRRM